MWKCPSCGGDFIDASDSHGCVGAATFTVGGEIPNGGRGERTDPALSRALDAKQALVTAMRLVLTTIGPRDGVEAELDPFRFDAAIYLYRPRAKFGPVTPLDRLDYAGRAALRILNQTFQEDVRVPGRFSVHADVRKIGEALHSRIKALAERHGVDPYEGIRIGNLVIDRKALG